MRRGNAQNAPRFCGAAAPGATTHPPPRWPTQCRSSKRESSGQQQTANDASTPLNRRAALAAIASAPWLALTAAAAAATTGSPLPPPPPPADLGESEGALNDCGGGDGARASCVSAYAESAYAFYAPWEFNATREAAVAHLIAVATGGRFDPGLSRDELNGAVGISRGDAAGFIVGTTLTTLAGKPPPPRPAPSRRAKFVPFDGTLMDRHTASDGSEYVWVAFGLPAAAAAVQEEGRTSSGDKPGAGDDGSSSSSGSSESDDSDGSSGDEAGGDGRRAQASSGRGGAGSGGGGGGGGAVDPSLIIDIEFSFPPGDSIANVRAASRADPPLARGRPALSLERGVVLDRNLARAKAEALRKALRWEPIAVLSADDPKFNDERPLVFERVFAPFVGLPGGGGGGGGSGL